MTMLNPTVPGHRASTATVVGAISSLRRYVTAWAATCADYYSAAALYEELRGMSDAELRNRGLARQTLAHDLCTANDRTIR